MMSFLRQKKNTISLETKHSSICWRPYSNCEKRSQEEADNGAVQQSVTVTLNINSISG